MEVTWLGIQISICWSQKPSQKRRGVHQKTSQYLVWPWFASWSVTDLVHIELIRLFDCCLWNVVPLLFKWLCEVAEYWLRTSKHAVVHVDPLSQPLLLVCSTSLSYRLRSPRIGKLPQSSPSSKVETPWTQTVTDLYPSCPAYLRSSKAKSTNRSLTISNPTVPSPLWNLVSEQLSAPQPRSRY
jgi:hypothetical protein